VGELARALGVPLEFVYRHAAELGAICLRLPDANGKCSSKFDRGGPTALPTELTICSTVTGWRRVTSRCGLGCGPWFPSGSNKNPCSLTIAFADGKTQWEWIPRTATIECPDGLLRRHAVRRLLRISMHGGLLHLAASSLALAARAVWLLFGRPCWRCQPRASQADIASS
jgi:hypothetical protein